jgi:alkanesulfonate monooxygenase SsuD/methylene tetrahydromethanopterin reductase-like flavin-dependent oxidoreductase (luciferase family)
MSTVNSTYSDPYEIAHQLASLDAISRGRGGWNVVTSAGATTSANFTAGDHVPRPERYPRAAEFVALTNRLFDSSATGVAFHGRHFDVTTAARLPDGDPQGRPVIMQAGESEAGREFAASSADLVFTGYGPGEKGRAFYADVKRRVRAHGRAPDAVKIMAGAYVHVGATDADAAQEYDEIRDALLTPAMVQVYLGRFWGRDFSAYDVEEPLPDIEPDWQAAGEYTASRIRGERDAHKVVADLKEIAERENLSMAGLARRVFDDMLMATIVGSPATVADLIEDTVDRRAADGFVFTSAVQPYGMDRFYDLVLPILRERGRFRTDYTGETLRDHLGLPM